MKYIVYFCSKIKRTKLDKTKYQLIHKYLGSIIPDLINY